jgi:hypothetical protein
MVEPNHLPDRERRQFTGIGRSRAAPMDKGHISRLEVLLGCFVQSRDIFVRVGKVLGTSMQKGNFNSKTLLLILAKSLEIVEKQEKCKLNFARF